MEDKSYERMGRPRSQNTIIKLAIAAVLVIAAVLSFTILASHFSSTDAYTHEIEQLDRRKATAASVSVAAAIASAGVTAIPQDVCTPIAQQLAEISKDMGIVTGAIILEKYAMTILGFALFRCILPLALIVLAVCILAPPHSGFKMPFALAASRVLLASFIIWFSVPLGVRTSDMIFSAYESTINEAVENAQLADELTHQNDKAENGRGDEGNSGFSFSIESFADAITSLPSNLADAVGSTVETVTDGVSVLVAWAKMVLTQMTEGFAVLVVTTCVVPLAVPLFMFWMTKLLFQPSSMLQPVPIIPGDGRALPGGCVGAASERVEQRDDN